MGFVFDDGIEGRAWERNNVMIALRTAAILHAARRRNRHAKGWPLPGGKHRRGAGAGEDLGQLARNDNINRMQWSGAFLAVVFLTAQTVSLAQSPPAGVGVSSWLREDMFAGLIGNDHVRLNIGLQKAYAILSENPDHLSALTWSCMGEMAFALKAHEDGQEVEFTSRFADGKQCITRAVALGPLHPGVYAVIGLTWSILAPRLPASIQAESYQAAYDAWRKGLQLSRARFGSMPEHSRGEYLAANAQSALRAGHKEEALGYLAEMTTLLPDSEYARRAATWMNRNDLMEKATPSCRGCHEPGKLANVLADKATQK